MHLFSFFFPFVFETGPHSIIVVGLELIELLPLPSDTLASSFSCVASEINRSFIHPSKAHSTLEIYNLKSLVSHFLLLSSFAWLDCHLPFLSITDFLKLGMGSTCTLSLSPISVDCLQVFWDRVSCIPVCLLEHLMPLLLAPKCWNYKCVPPCLLNSEILHLDIQ